MIRVRRAGALWTICCRLAVLFWSQTLAGSQLYLPGSRNVEDKTFPLFQQGSRSHPFTQTVLERENQCVMTRFRCWLWMRLEAAHVFPLAHQAYWIQIDFDFWITDKPDGSIYSVQNWISFYKLLAIGYSTCMRSLLIHMSGDTISFHCAVADCWVRTTTKLSSLSRDRLEIEDKCLDQQFPPPTISYDGIPGRLCWLIWEVLGRSFWNTVFLHALILCMGQILCAPQVVERMEFE